MLQTVSISGMNLSAPSMTSRHFPSHQPYLDSIADELNDRPCAVLGLLTPREVFTKLLNDDVAKTG